MFCNKLKKKNVCHELTHDREEICHDKKLEINFSIFDSTLFTTTYTMF